MKGRKVKLSVKDTKFNDRGITNNNYNHSTYLSSLEAQRNFMNQLALKLKINSIDDWKFVSNEKFIKNGGNELLSPYYSNNLKKLLVTLYPSHIWLFKEKLSTKKQFKIIEYQIDFMEKIYKEFQFTCLEDFQSISKKKLIEQGGKSLIEFYYHGDIKKLLSTVFPNFPWLFEDENNNNNNNNNNIHSIENQRKIMNNLFQKLKLIKLNDWLKVKKKEMIDKGASKLLSIYSNDMKKLLTTIYPDHPWKFPNKKYKNNKFTSIDDQRQFMDNLFIKLKLKTMDDWRSITPKEITQNGGERLISFYYSNDMKKLLSTIYPTIDWSESANIVVVTSKFASIDYQKQFMDNLYVKLNLQSLNDWLKYSQGIIIKYGGKILINKYYAKSMSKLLANIYPTHPWPFINQKLKINRFSMENQQKYMENLFYQLKFQRMDDWLSIYPNNFIKYKGKWIIDYYENDMQKLLTSIYPNYCWKFENLKIMGKFRSIEYQSSFMDHLFRKFKLKSLDDWINIKKRKIFNSGGKSLINYYYNDDYQRLLSTIYPNFPWNFDLKFDVKIDLNNLDDQRLFMNKLYDSLRLNSLDDFLRVRKILIKENGGTKLLSFYSYDMKKLLSSIYPFHPWKFQELEMGIRESLQSFDNQKLFMEKLFCKLKLKKTNDWLRVTRTQLIHFGARKLLEIYSYDMKKLLLTIYPDHHWEFALLKYQGPDQFNDITQIKRTKIKFLLEKYYIQSKEDWYRLSLRTGDIKVFTLLKSTYPYDNWDKEKFSNRNKKTTQRILFLLLKRIYYTYAVYENFRHPLILCDYTLELDVFIPALNLAFEYQGQQHYDDIPHVFGSIELNKIRDQLKEELAKKININTVHIPYWWDRSYSSLLSSTQKFFSDGNLQFNSLNS